jgi:hypothetical protein
MFTGQIVGRVSVDTVRIRLWGKPALTMAGLLAVIVVMLRLLQGGAGRGDTVFGPLLVPVIVLVYLVGIFYVLLGGSLAGYGRLLGRSAGRAAKAASRVAVQGTAAGARGGLGAVGRARVGEHDEAARRFRVQTVTGDVHACLLLGDPEGDDVRQGDIVHVTGRRTRQGHYVVTRVDVLSGPSGPVISTVLPRGLGGAVWGDRAATVLAALVLVWSVTGLARLGG